MKYYSIVTINLLGLALLQPLNAQITISENSLVQPGTSTIQHSMADQLPKTAGPSGADQHWVIPEQQFAAHEVTFYQAPQTSPYGDQFTSATLCLYQPASNGISEQWSYRKASEDGLNSLGFVFKGHTQYEAHYADDALIMPLPLSMSQPAWTSVIRFSYESSGRTIQVLDSTISEVDGWGTLSTQFGEYNTLRVFERSWTLIRYSNPNGAVAFRGKNYVWINEQGLRIAKLFVREDADTVFALGLLQPITISAVASRENPVNYVVVKQNYPNPYNPVTMIPVELLQAGRLQLRIFNMNGQLVSDDAMDFTAGAHTIPINSTSWASGNYFATILQNGAAQTIRMNLIK